MTACQDNKDDLETQIHCVFNEQNLNINKYFDVVVKDIVKHVTIEVDKEIKISY